MTLQTGQTTKKKEKKLQLDKNYLEQQVSEKHIIYHNFCAAGSYAKRWTGTNVIP